LNGEASAYFEILETNNVTRVSCLPRAMISQKTLATLSLFRDSGPCVVEALSRRAVEVRFAPDEVIFLAGARSRGWFVVVEGLVRVVRASGSRQHVIHAEGPGGTLGEVPLFTDGTHPATGIAAEPTRCALFDRATLESAIAECPDIALLITKRLAFRVQNLVARLDGRSAKSARVRLIEFLLERARASDRDSFSIGMTQQDLAEELGTVREIVSREFRRLAREKWIVSLSGGRYRLLDIDALRNAATDTDS
jgi:CRP/FNR family transcriptional regulator